MRKKSSFDRLQLFTVVMINHSLHPDCFDINIKNDRNDYIDMCVGVPKDVVFDCMMSEDVRYMLDRDLDECGYFAIRRTERDKIRQSAAGYESKKYDYIHVDYDDDWE